MRERRAGRIINVSSVGGRITLPYFGVYNSTKYAVESLSDALRYELRPFGIDVALIEPGVIRTNFEATAVAGLDRFAASPYAGALANYERMSRLADRLASEPIVVASAIARAVAARRPAARYVAPRSTPAVRAAERAAADRGVGLGDAQGRLPDARRLDLTRCAALPAAPRPAPASSRPAPAR